MFKTGDYIHYSSSGLCCVEDITKLEIPGADSSRLYYRLQPLDSRKGTIYTPVDNQKVAMRRALSRSEAEELIDRIPDIEVLTAATDKEQEQSYKNALHSVDCVQWVRVIKTLYQRRQNRVQGGKKPTASEERYFKNAVEMLHEELAQAVGIEPEEVEAFIAQRVERG